jgi:hypothetical protein
MVPKAGRRIWRSGVLTAVGYTYLSVRCNAKFDLLTDQNGEVVELVLSRLNSKSHYLGIDTVPPSRCSELRGPATGL